MGNFSQLNDDDAELLAGGVDLTQNPARAYGGSGTNYGLSNGTARNKPPLDNPNPSTLYGGTNYGQSKKN